MSKKQHVEVRSGTKEEYMRLTHVTTDHMWIQTFLQDLCVSATLLAHNPILHVNTKYLEIYLFFVRDKAISLNICSCPYVKHRSMDICVHQTFLFLKISPAQGQIKSNLQTQCDRPFITIQYPLSLCQRYNIYQAM